MPIEIRELVVKAKINEGKKECSSAKEENFNRNGLSAQSVSASISEILKRQKER